MTKPTTAECIEWLDSGPVNGVQKCKDSKIRYAIRAQLLAAQEMAKALKQSRGMDYNDCVTDDLMRKALTAWREVGGN